MSNKHEQGKILVESRFSLNIFEDCIRAYSDKTGRIRQFPLEQKKSYKSISSKNLQNINRPEVECVYAYDVISFARELGFFSGNDADFSFRDAYCPIDFENVRYADARVWSFFRHHYNKAEMDKYLPYTGHEPVILHVDEEVEEA